MERITIYLRNEDKKRIQEIKEYYKQCSLDPNQSAIIRTAIRELHKILYNN